MIHGRGWIHAWTCSRKQQMHNSCIFTVFSNMANHSFNFFVSFSINDWKENVQSLNNSPFWEETQSFICFCQLTVNETVFLSLLANAVNSGYDRGQRCFICSAVFLAMLTCWHVQFSKIFAFLFFSKSKLLFPGKIDFAKKSRVPKQWQSGLTFLCGG